MRIIVDGDACPGKQFIEKAAKENSLEVIIYCNYNHMIESEYSTVVFVDSTFQGVDMKIANEAKANDIIVTQDYGVAAMVLAKGAYAVNTKGYIYSNENIDRLLFERHISQKVRSSGGKHVSASKRKNEDDVRLYNNILSIINKYINEKS